MISAVIDHGHNTLVLQLPVSLMDLRLKLVSIGIRVPPDQIPLYATDDHQTKVQIFGETDIGKHLCQLLGSENTLADANIAAYLTANADLAIKDTVEQRITGGQYKNIEQLTADILKLTQSAGPVKKEFFFPLTGNIDEGDGDLYTVGDSFLYDYRYDIAEAIERHQARDIENIASFYNDEDGVREKLVSADWSTEVVDGTLYGKVTVRLRAELTEEETTVLRDWISGQNSDGAFECLEDYPIETEDGSLAISLWHGGNDYFVCGRDELDEYIEQLPDMKMGVM